jgi:hypothetical protein
MPQKGHADEAPLEAAHGWADGLQAGADRMGPRCPRAEPRQRADASVQGLLRPLERQNGWHLAAHAGEKAP